MPSSRGSCVCYDGFRAEIEDAPAERFLARFFRRCKKYLTAELIRLRPIIVIALGEPTHRLLVSAYKKRGWKDTGSRFSIVAGFKEMMDGEGFYPVRKFRADDPTEVRVAEHACKVIPKIGSLPGCADFLTDSERTIEPLFIPGFRLFGDPAGRLAQQPMRYEAINVLAEGGDYGDRRAD